MIARNVIRTNRPFQGLVAFVPTLLTAAAMGSLGACGAALNPAYPTRKQLLARDEDRVHPGEGSA